MSKQVKLTNYVSDIDQFLQNFDKTHPHLSKTQQAEIKKHERVYHLRDSAERQVDAKNPLDDF